jgi:ribosomal protein L1
VAIIRRKASMNEDTFNMTVRKFLKNVGVTSQREIEKAVDEALRSGKLKGDESFNAKITLEVNELGLKEEINGKINLE